MPDDLVAYVQSAKLTDWKRIALGYRLDDAPCFIYGSDDDQQFEDHAKGGATLWVIESQPDQPPSLVAKLTGIQRLGSEVKASELPAGVLRRFRHKKTKDGPLVPYRAYVLGDKESVFLPHNDASDALCQLWLEHQDRPRRVTDTARKGRRIGPRWRTGYGLRLLRPRRILSGAKPLMDLAERSLERSAFISWKHRDHTRPWRELRRLAAALIRAGFSCWWDALALPDSRSLRSLEKKGADPEMKRLLRYGLAQSRVLLTYASAHYGQPSSPSGQNWTQEEWDQASPRSKPWRVVFPWDDKLVERTLAAEECGVDLRECAHRITARPPSAVAKELARWLKTQPSETAD